jgi:hypothetical protein
VAVRVEELSLPPTVNQLGGVTVQHDGAASPSSEHTGTVARRSGPGQSIMFTLVFSARPDRSPNGAEPGALAAWRHTARHTACCHHIVATRAEGVSCGGARTYRR